MALFFAREGANVTIAYLPEEEKDAQVVEKLVKESPMGTKDILRVPGNLESESHAKEIVTKHLEKWGTIDILVNNASKQVPCQNFEEIDLNVTESTFEATSSALLHSPNSPSLT